MELIYTGVNRNKFHNELNEQGIYPDPVKAGKTDDEIILTMPDDTPQSTLDQIEQIYQNHDPAPTPPQPTEADYLLDLDFRLSMLELGL